METPTIAEYRARLAEDAQAKRYSHEVLVAIMRCLDETPDLYNDHSLNRLAIGESEIVHGPSPVPLESW